MRRALLSVAILIALPISALALTGDCDDDGTVELPELVRGVVIALGTRPLQDCEPFDENGDGVIDVAELIAGVSLSMTSQPTATATPSKTGTVLGTPTDTPTGGATPTSTTSPSDTPTGTLSPTPSATLTPTLDVNASPTSTATVTATAEPSATSTASATATRTPQSTATVSVTRTPSNTATPTSSPTRTRTPTATVTPTVTPTLPHFVVFDFGSAGTGGIPCITTSINFLLLAGTTNVRDLRIDFCVDPANFDAAAITCQAQNAGATIDPVENQLSCGLEEPDDPHGQVRVTAHGVGGAALPGGQVLVQCSVPVLATTLTGTYAVDYSIRGTTTGNESFVDFGQSFINIFADDLSQGQCCGADSQCSSGFCRGGAPERDSACCENDCGDGVCNDPFAPGTCLAQPGGEFHVSTVTYRSQYLPAVAVLDNGFVVAWHGNALDIGTNSTDIFARRYDRFGAPVAEITVNQALIGAQRWADVAPLGNDFVVVWLDAYGVHGRQFNGYAVALGDQFQVSTYSGSYQSYPSVDTAPDGSFVVVWGSFGQDGDAYGVFGQRFDSSGSTVEGEFQVNTHTNGFQRDATVRFAGNGGFVVVWQDYSRGAIGQRFTSKGESLGTEIVVADLSGRPALDMDGDGGFVVTGESFDGSYFPGIFARRFDSGGSPVGDRFQVNSYTFDGQTYGAVALDSDGSFVIVWDSFGQDGYNFGIFGQRFDSTGGRLGSEFAVNTFTTHSEKQAAIAAGDGAGGFVVVWQRDGLGYLPQILGQRLP